MPEKKILGTFDVEKKRDKRGFFEDKISKKHEYFKNLLDEAFSIENRTYKSICLFSIIDCFVQDYYNYDNGKNKEHFCGFVLQFQKGYDYLKEVEPVSLYYDYEQNIRKIVKYSELNRLYPNEYPPEPEVTIYDGSLVDGMDVRKMVNSGKAAELLGIIERDKGLDDRKRYFNKHRLITLIYKLRSKRVHEMSLIGGENKWEAPEGRREPFYRNINRIYPEGSNIVGDEVYELVFPNRFIYELACSCVNNYFEYCRNRRKMPFENDKDYKRNVYLTWRD